MFDNAIFLDIETIPAQNLRIIMSIRSRLMAELNSALDGVCAPSNYKDAEKIAAYVLDAKKSLHDKFLTAIDTEWRKTSLDGAFGQAAVVSIAVAGGEPEAIYERDWSAPGAERRVLEATNDRLSDICKHRMGQLLVGHNILGFDRKFLRQRGIIHGLRMHSLLTREVKPWDAGAVYDTMTAWTGDFRDRVSMSKLCLILGVADKGSELDEDIDGSLVWDFVRGGKIDKVARYCDYDVIRTREIYKRLNFLGAAAPAETLDDIPL